MKKILAFLLISIILVACSSNNLNQTAIKGSTLTSKITERSSTWQKTEIQIEDTGLSLMIPNAWNTKRYKIYLESNAINIDYIEEGKNIPFFYIIAYGKKDEDVPKVGAYNAAFTVDDWGFIASYAHGSVILDAPVNYNNMAKDVYEIVSSLKITDKSKFEKWYKGYSWK